MQNKVTTFVRNRKNLNVLCVYMVNERVASKLLCTIMIQRGVEGAMLKDQRVT